jgi:hypothetical protein
MTKPNKDSSLSLGIISLVGNCNYSKCPRCRKYTQEGLNNYNNLCDRCCSTLIQDFPKHETTVNIISKTKQQPEYWNILLKEKISLGEDEHISISLERFGDILPNEALSNLEIYLGPNYKAVINFWSYVNNFSLEDWSKINLQYSNLDDIASINTSKSSNNHTRSGPVSLDTMVIPEKAIQVRNFISNSAWWAAYEASAYAVLDSSLTGAVAAVGYATWELMAMLKTRDVEPTFLPLFI